MEAGSHSPWWAVAPEGLPPHPPRDIAFPGRARGGASAPHSDLRSHPRLPLGKGPGKDTVLSTAPFGASRPLIIYQGRRTASQLVFANRTAMERLPQHLLRGWLKMQVLGAQPRPAGSEQLSVHDKREAQGMESLPLPAPCAWVASCPALPTPAEIPGGARGSGGLRAEF